MKEEADMRADGTLNAGEVDGGLRGPWDFDFVLYVVIGRVSPLSLR